MPVSESSLPGPWRPWWASFLRHLRAENRSDATLSTYTQSVEAFCRCAGPDDPLAVRRSQVEEFIAVELERNSPSTARIRFVSLRAFYNWLVAEGELERSPLERMRPPKVPDRAPAALTADHVAQLLRACAGRDFLSRRDAAIIRLMFDCGVRRTELVSMDVDDVDLAGQVAMVTGKGGHREPVYFGVKVARDLDRYLRVRQGHPKAPGERRLWLAQKGALTGSGLYQMLQDRAALAGLDMHVRPHLFRHSFADALKSAGASDEDTMRLGRWRDPAVMQRYGRRLADQRARETHRRLSPGDRV
jgi:site-specific recombinase XerD